MQNQTTWMEAIPSYMHIGGDKLPSWKASMVKRLHREFRLAQSQLKSDLTNGCNGVFRRPKDSLDYGVYV